MHASSVRRHVPVTAIRRNNSWEYYYYSVLIIRVREKECLTSSSASLSIFLLRSFVEWDILGVHLGLTENEIEQDYHKTARRRIDSKHDTWTIS